MKFDLGTYNTHLFDTFKDFGDCKYCGGNFVSFEFWFGSSKNKELMNEHPRIDDRIKLFQNGDIDISDLGGFYFVCTTCGCPSDAIWIKEKDLKDSIFKRKVEELKSKLMYMSIDEIERDTHYNIDSYYSREWNAPREKVKFIVEGTKSDINNLQVLLEKINDLCCYGSTRRILLEVDGDGSTGLRIYREDGVESNYRMMEYGRLDLSPNKAYCKLSDGSLQRLYDIEISL